MNPPRARYTVYLMIDPRDRVPFYAGMTCRPGTRWVAHNGRASTSASPRLKELRDLGLKCRVRIVGFDLTYHDARAKEAGLINAHRAVLLNRQSVRITEAA